MKRCDLAIIGGGTGGIVSALIAAGVGAKVTLIERDRTGGDCLWTGCVPSKSLIAAATLAHRIRHADTVGITPSQPPVDFAKVMAHVWRTIHTIEAQDSAERLRRAGVEVLDCKARFRSPRQLDVDGHGLSYRAAIIATGSHPVAPPIGGLADCQPLSTDTVWDLRELPRRLLVLGGGPIGCELAQAFTRLGAAVTIVEMADRLLVKEEPSASELIASRLRGEGIDIRLKTRAREVDTDADGSWRLLVQAPGGQQTIPFDRVLVAAGRVPRTSELALERVGVRCDQRGAVIVDRRLRTTARGIYAVGDVTGLLPFTHVAAHHARVATPNALFHTRSQVAETIPWVTFTDPEVARVGLSEQQARERFGDRISVAQFDYEELDRAILAGEPYGFVKLIAGPSRRLLGATVAAPGAGEAIAEMTAWIASGAKIDAVSRTVHAYPTLAEGPCRAADAHLAERYASPQMRAVTRSVLAALRLLDRIRGGR